MPTPMEDDQIEAVLAEATLVEDGGHPSTGEDGEGEDYISAELYRTPSGRHFRYVSASGMNSPFAGAGNFAEWLDESELDTWDAFD